jgi:hypothetical protein
MCPYVSEGLRVRIKRTLGYLLFEAERKPSEGKGLGNLGRNWKGAKLKWVSNDMNVQD